MLLRFALSLIFMLLILPMLVHAAEPRACMTEHMTDAIKLNEQRRPLYARLSNGQSQEITDRLVRIERSLLVGAPLADLWARTYQRADINIVCGDLVPMSETPKFQGKNPEGKVLRNTYRPVLVNVVVEKLQEQLNQENYGGLAWLADQYVQQLEKQPRFNCLVRHMLESIRRGAMLAPEYEQQAQRKNLISPLPLSKKILQAHIDLLQQSAAIDKKAAPLQADGIMIICQDVPHIPAP